MLVPISAQMHGDPYCHNQHFLQTATVHGRSIRQSANLTRVGQDVNIYDDWNLGHQDSTNQYANETPLQNITKTHPFILP